MIAGPDGWILTPEGAAVLNDRRTAVIADVHLGYEWSRGRSGDALPAHSLRETLARLDSLFHRVPLDRLIVAGDLVESATPCRRTAEDLQTLRSRVSDLGIDLVWLRGNHDPRRRPALASTFLLDSWTIGHGDRPIAGDRVIFGHHHPVLRADGLTAPCFLHSKTKIALPAFSANSAGLDVASAPLPSILRDPDLRCAAGIDGLLLDFGPLSRLSTAMMPVRSRRLIR